MVDQTYTIPYRFGLRAILLLTAIFAVVFAVMKATEADLRVVAPMLSFVVLVCLAQMVFGRVPRLASAAVGGLVFPVSAYIDPIFEGRWRLQTLSALDLFWFIVCGLLAGYMGGVLLAGIFLIADRLQLSTRRIYVVPRKFGIGTILLATTLFAMLFAFLQWANARPAELFFYTSFVVTVGLSQMILPRTPRWASMVAGAVFLPMSIVLYGRLGRRWMLPRGEDLDSLAIIAAIGALIGYLGGTLIAGIFLLSDYAVKLVWSRRRASRADPSSADESLGHGTLSSLAERAVAARRNYGGNAQ